MVNFSMEEELHQHFILMSIAQQQLVLQFARFLSNQQPKGVKGSHLLSCAGSIPREDLLEMQSAIEEGCEKVDTDEW